MSEKKVRRRAYAALIVSGALLIAACGSSKKSTAPSGATTTAAPAAAATTTAAAAATTTAAPAATTTAAAATTTAAAASGIKLDQAKATVAQFTKRPTTIPNKTPIGKDIPAGKKVYFISCGVPACEAEAAIIKQATDILGWTLTSISTDPTKPEQIPAAWDRVAKEKPDAVLYTATPRAQISSQFDAVKANGTQIIGCCVTDKAENGLQYTVSTPDQTGELGNVIASWMVADAGGKAAKAVYLDLPDFPILSSLKTNFQKSLTDLCSTCSSEVINFGLADLAKANDQVVSYLRAHTDVKYVIQSTDSTFSLPAALDAAGLKDIRIFGEGPTAATLADIEAGRQAGTMVFGFYEVMFSMVDSAVRQISGLPQEATKPPNWIIAKGTIPKANDAGIFPVVDDVIAQYKKLWGK